MFKKFKIHLFHQDQDKKERKKCVFSCNGCRVLRKGCSEDCSIRPCLQWLKSPDSQANVTVFLAKFYGRAGLINLINAGPIHLRPAIFRSLLYEACGRMVNPVYGSVGLLWSGSWHLCQSAVESVLKGAPIVQITPEAASEPQQSLSLKPYDIRHVMKDETSTDVHKVKNRCRFKRAGVRPNGKAVIKPVPDLAQDTVTGFDMTPDRDEDLHLSTSHHSSVSYAEYAPKDDDESGETESMASDGTIETSVLFGVEPESMLNDAKRNERMENAGVEMLRLELTLGLEPVACEQNAVGGCGSCKRELTLY